MSASNADDGINQKIDKPYKKIDKSEPSKNGGARGRKGIKKRSASKRCVSTNY